MQWLKKILGKEDKFFDLLEAGAEEARTSVNLLSRYGLVTALHAAGL